MPLPSDNGLPICLRQPIPEIEWAARTVLAAMESHLAGDIQRAGSLIESTNIIEIRNWTESLWGKDSAYVDPRVVAGAPRQLSKAERIPVRMPDRANKERLLAQQGWHCRFCGIPLIRPETRTWIRSKYKDALPWGTKNNEQHAAFQAMWLQYDHLVPHARGGTNDLENILITCAPCNYARMHYTIEELGLEDPRLRRRVESSWEGLESFRIKASVHGAQK